MSEGSPPDTFTWMKDGVILNSTIFTTVTHTSTAAVFHTEYNISRVTANDSGTYTCTVTNPIGSDLRNFHVRAAANTGKCKSQWIFPIKHVFVNMQKFKYTLFAIHILFVCFP